MKSSSLFIALSLACSFTAGAQEPGPSPTPPPAMETRIYKVPPGFLSDGNSGREGAPPRCRGKRIVLHGGKSTQFDVSDFSKRRRKISGRLGGNLRGGDQSRGGAQYPGKLGNRADRFSSHGPAGAGGGIIGGGMHISQGSECPAAGDLSGNPALVRKINPAIDCVSSVGRSGEKVCDPQSRGAPPWLREARTRSKISSSRPAKQGISGGGGYKQSGTASRLT